LGPLRGRDIYNHRVRGGMVMGVGMRTRQAERLLAAGAIGAILGGATALEFVIEISKDNQRLRKENEELKKKLEAKG